MISSFLGIIIAGSLSSGIGRFISGADFLTGVTDGVFISLAICIVSYLRTKFSQYTIIGSLIIGFFVGGIPGIIAGDKLVFFTSAISGGLLCLSFILAKNQLLLYLSAGMISGFLSHLISNVCIGLVLLNSINIRIIFFEALYGAIWGGLIILGIKLSTKRVINNVLIYLFYGLAIAAVIWLARFMAIKFVQKFSIL